MVKENKKNAPACVGIIMDGNRRWSKEQGVSAALGHREGYKKLKEVVIWAKEEGIENLVVYAFSTENWNRSKKEINTLMKLFGNVLKQQDFFKKEKINVRFIGHIDKFSDDLKKGIKEMENSTKKYDNLKLSIALSYGGRAEIVSAVNSLLQRGIKKVSEDEFSKEMWMKDNPDPEIIIRTGGEKRLSNFLAWQSVYSELFFVDTYWPAFTKNEFKGIVAKYFKREKRKGK